MYLVVGKKRRDGKIPVQLLYLNSQGGGTQMRKLVDTEELEVLKVQASKIIKKGYNK